MTGQKRGFLGLILFTVTFLVGQAQEGRGWHLVNTTSTPIGVAWYTKSISPQAPEKNNAARQGEPTLIAPGSTEFIGAPAQYEDTFTSLALTQSPALLKATLSSQEGEMEGIFLYDKKTHPFLRKPLLRYVPSMPKLYIGQGKGTSHIGLITSIEPLDSETLFEKGWYVVNKARKTLYAGWYVAEWDRKKHAYTNPFLAPAQHLFAIEPGEKAPVVPQEEKRNQKWQLLMSFNKESLTHEIASDLKEQGIIARTKADFSKLGTQWHAYAQDGIPTLIPHSYLLHITNTTNNPLYCAMFYVDSSGATKYGPKDYVTEILPQLSCEIIYPPSQWWRTTKLLIAREDQKALLHEEFLDASQVASLCAKDFIKSSFANWYIEGAFAIEPHRIDPNRLHVASIGGGLIERLARKAVDIDSFKGSRIKKYESAFLRKDPLYMPDSEIIAAQGNPSVLTHRSQKTMEEEFVEKRTEHVRIALNKLFGKEVILQGDPVPKIALVFTGGGYRAMIETIGFMEGAASEAGGNIFDCCLYISALSGSTWAVNGLVASGLSPQGFAEHQKYKVGEGGMVSLKKLISNLIEQSASYPKQRFIESRYTQFHGPIGLYGHAISHALLHGFKINGRDAHTMRLSDLRSHLLNAQYPLPLSVAVEPGATDKERVWYEFSPYYCGTFQEQGSWVDTKLLGSTFHKGCPVHIVPEYPLAHYMGIWGSAFALSQEDIAKESTFGGFLTNSAAQLGTGLSKAYALLFAESSEDPLSPRRFTAGTMPNYNYYRPEALEGIASKPLLHFIDAGITMEGKERHNFATIPALWRDVDILIMCDCNGLPNSDLQCEYLLAADEEARRQRMPFPNLTRSTLHRSIVKAMDKEVASLFVEDRAPLVVYMKAKKNKIYDGFLAGQNGPFVEGFDPDMSVTPFTATTNFTYTPEQYEVLRGLTKSIFIQSKECIKAAIEKAWLRSEQK